MTTQKFSKGEALCFGWNIMKSNLGFFIGLLMITWLFLLIVPNYAAVSPVLKANVFLGVILSIANFALTIVISMGMVKIALRFCDNEKGRFSDLFSQYRLFFNYLFAWIIYALIVFVGTLLLIVPGIIWGIKFWFFDYFIVDKKLGPVEALKRSYAITAGVKWDLFVFFLMLLGINLLGALCLLVGLFASIPTTMIAAAFVYRKLLTQTEIALKIKGTDHLIHRIPMVLIVVFFLSFLLLLYLQGIDILIQKLKHENLWVRGVTTLVLGMMGRPAIEPPDCHTEG